MSNGCLEEEIAAVIKGQLDSVAMVIDGEVMANLYEPREVVEVLKGVARGIAKIIARSSPGFNEALFLEGCGFDFDGGREL